MSARKPFVQKLLHAGITCPECGRPGATVRDSRPVANALRRRRFCEHCGCRFTTHEMPQGEEAATEVNRRIAMLARRLDALPQDDRLAVMRFVAAIEARTAAEGESAPSPTREAHHVIASV